MCWDLWQSDIKGVWDVAQTVKVRKSVRYIFVTLGRSDKTDVANYD
jgi:hypothetical protein